MSGSGSSPPGNKDSSIDTEKRVSLPQYIFICFFFLWLAVRGDGDGAILDFFRRSILLLYFRLHTFFYL